MLTKAQRSGLAILLAALDDNFTIYSMRFSKVNNKKIYFIKSKDEEISISANSFELENLGEYLEEIVEKVGKNLNINFIDGMDLNTKIAGILNHIKDEFLDELEKTYGDIEEEDRIIALYEMANERQQSITDLVNYANVTDGEDRILAYADTFSLITFTYSDPFMGEDIEDHLRAIEKSHAEEQEDFNELFNLHWIDNPEITNAKLEKTDLERIKLLLISLISKDTSVSIVANAQIENIGCGLFRGLDPEEEEPEELYFHNRKSGDLEALSMKIKLYNAITNANNYPMFDDTNKQEEVVFDILNQNIKRFKMSNMDMDIDSFIDMLDCVDETNLGREKLLIETYLITAATLGIDVDGVNKIPIFNFNKSALESTIKQNYELLKRDKSIFRNFRKLLYDIKNIRSELRKRFEKGEVLDKKEATLLAKTNLAFKNAIKDISYTDNLTGKFENIEENYKTEEYTDYDEIDDNYEDFDDLDMDDLDL